MHRNRLTYHPVSNLKSDLDLPAAACLSLPSSLFHTAVTICHIQLLTKQPVKLQGKLLKLVPGQCDQSTQPLSVLLL